MPTVCFNPLKHQQLQQNKEALFECVFAHSLGAYTRRVFLATSSLGYIMAFEIVMENKLPQNKYNLFWHRWFKSLTDCQRVRLIGKRTVVRRLTQTVIQGYHADHESHCSATEICLNRKPKGWETWREIVHLMCHSPNLGFMTWWKWFVIIYS